MRVQRHTSGSVRYDKRRKTWNYLWYDGPIRRSKRIGTKQEFPTKAAAWQEVERLEVQQTKPQSGTTADTVRSVITRYEAERMPSRPSTARMYRCFFKNHVSPKSKTHVRSLMHGLVEFAMWAGMLDIARNPVSLVRNIGATRKVRQARSLTAEQFQALLKELQEPFATMALLSVCLGLRISEALAPQWADVDWLGSRLSVRRGIVNQIAGDVKTQGSAKTFNLANELLERLKSWKQSSEFSGAEDWVFASPFKLGKLPYSYTGTRQELKRASKTAGIGHVSSHAFRHTYRTWLDAVKTPIAVQQKMMRHTDIRTTMNVYGDVVTDEMSTAGLRVAELAFQINGAQAERKASYVLCFWWTR